MHVWCSLVCSLLPNSESLAAPEACNGWVLSTFHLQLLPQIWRLVSSSTPFPLSLKCPQFLITVLDLCFSFVAKLDPCVLRGQNTNFSWHLRPMIEAVRPDQHPPIQYWRQKRGMWCGVYKVDLDPLLYCRWSLFKQWFQSAWKYSAAALQQILYKQLNIAKYTVVTLLFSCVLWRLI